MLATVFSCGALWLSLWSEPASPDLRLALAATPLAEELEPLLVAELGAASLASEADLRLIAEEVEGALQVVLRHGERTILDRRLSLAGGRLPALRAAVLAIVEARRLESVATEAALRPAPAPPVVVTRTPTVAAPPPPPEEDLEPARPRLNLEPTDPAIPSAWAGLDLGLLWAGGAPQLGLELRGALPLASLRVGLGAGLFGLGCCQTSVDTAEAVTLDGRFLIATLRAEAEWAALQWGPVELGPTAAVGAEWLQIDANPAIFPGDEVRSQTTHWTAALRAGVVARGPISARFGWVSRLGLEIRSGPVAVALPEGFPIVSEDLSAGRFAPYLTVGGEAAWF